MCMENMPLFLLVSFGVEKKEGNARFRLRLICHGGFPLPWSSVECTAKRQNALRERELGGGDEPGRP
jgi:hypothetical protein